VTVHGRKCYIHQNTRSHIAENHNHCTHPVRLRTHERISALPRVTFLLSFPLDVEFLPSSATGDVTTVSILVLELN